jgi:hypothetical protein
MKIIKYRVNTEILDSLVGKTSWFDVVDTHTVDDVLHVLQRDNPHCLIQRRMDMEDGSAQCYTYTHDDERWYVYIAMNS